MHRSTALNHSHSLRGLPGLPYGDRNVRLMVLPLTLSKAVVEFLDPGIARPSTPTSPQASSPAAICQRQMFSKQPQPPNLVAWGTGAQALAQRVREETVDQGRDGVDAPGANQNQPIVAVRTAVTFDRDGSDELRRRLWCGAAEVDAGPIKRAHPTSISSVITVLLVLTPPAALSPEELPHSRLCVTPLTGRAAALLSVSRGAVQRVLSGKRAAHLQEIRSLSLHPSRSQKMSPLPQPSPDIYKEGPSVRSGSSRDGAGATGGMTEGRMRVSGSCLPHTTQTF
ncbi:unnamed protein product [Lota lota]